MMEKPFGIVLPAALPMPLADADACEKMESLLHNPEARENEIGGGRKKKQKGNLNIDQQTNSQKAALPEKWIETFHGTLLRLSTLSNVFQ